MFRKQSVLCCCGGLPLLTPRSRAPPSSRQLSGQQLPCRLYASAASDCSETELSWPTTPSFTPYDIFRLDRNAPYSKHRFYELVKLYHPDRPCNGHPLCKDLSEEVRLRRYRLIVAAHEILSDPVKRAAYDKDGTGWLSHPDRPDLRTYPKRHAQYGSHQYGSRQHGSPEDPIFANGTWEDWERWYNRHQPKQQVQVVSHSTFVTFILLLALFGGVAQASWITQYKTSFDQRIQEMNAQSARFLAGRRQQTTDQLKSMEARVQNFLIRRDPSGYGLKEEEESVYKQVLDPRRRELPNSHLREGLKGKQIQASESGSDGTG
ncbi:hypothetical protein VTN77DRAFT_596 [Rasamsonia byssochlamydoides]|uniref:uncharacterized protein n=1 Tax=Rasamsonia byssochlamydoides TaxID=89139 RepID=UPI0037438F5C